MHKPPLTKIGLYVSMLFILAMASDASAQKLDHVLGDILVELPVGKSISPIARLLQTTVNGDVQFRQVIKEPKNIWLIHLDPNRNNENHILTKIKANQLVVNAQKNHITTNRAVPNDPRFIDQWQYINEGTNGGIANADLDMDLAWDITTGGLTAERDTIVVCIIDDGVNLEHPDLKANLWKNRQEIPDNNIDDDNNGYIDDFHGWDVYQGDGNVSEDGSHGTPVAGIVGAVGNNSTGVVGVNWNIKLMIIEGGSPESAAIASYAYAYNMRKRYNETNGAEGAFVVATNSSWGVDRGMPEDAPIWCDFYNVMGEVGILSCGATANSDLNVDTEGDLPTACGSDYLISVTNIKRDDLLDNAAGYGQRSIDLGAYGENTYTITKNNYGPFGGTSGATPHVAGVIGLLYSIDCGDFMENVKSDPSRSALAVKDYILNGTVPLESLDEITVTGGKLNANNSLINAIAICEEPCSEGAGLFIDEAGLFEATAKFALTPNTGEVQMRYRAIGTTSWLTITALNGEVQLQDLDACTTYEYQSRTICDNPNATYGYPKIFQTEGCCEAPAIIDIQVEDDIATLRWSETVGANEITVEYKENGATVWSTLVLDGMTTEITIPNVENCTAYEVRLMAKCQITNRESDFATGQFSGSCGTCTNDYCEIVPKDTSDEWIETVTIENVFTNNSGDNGGYGSFIGALDINLEKSQFHTIILTPGYSSGAFTEFFSVYIDFDQDGLWSQQERVFVDLQPVDQETSGTFVIPQGALLGITRMRVIMRFSEVNDNSCDDDNWIYGEYEDYCVNILPPAECPASLEVISDVDSTISSIAFDITSSSLIDSFTVDYISAAGIAKTAIFQTNAILLQGLEQCTLYDIVLTGTCSDGTEISGNVQLKTSCSTSTINLSDADLVIYPNPSQQYLQIRNDGNRSISKVTILNISGQLVLDSNVIPSESELQITETANLEAGLYIVRIATDQGIVIKKWLKSN